VAHEQEEVALNLADEARVKVEWDDEVDQLALSGYKAPAPVDSAIDRLTDSQEDVLLAQSVTKSQSDFSHWLEETLRLAKGDGTSTVSTLLAYRVGSGTEQACCTYPDRER
jgi:hypothetical protein